MSESFQQIVTRGLQLINDNSLTVRRQHFWLGRSTVGHQLMVKTTTSSTELFCTELHCTAIHYTLLDFSFFSFFLQSFFVCSLDSWQSSVIGGFRFWLSSSQSSRSSNHLSSQIVRARKLTFRENVHHPPHVTCHVSLLSVMCHYFFSLFITGQTDGASCAEGPLSMGPTLSSLQGSCGFLGAQQYGERENIKNQCIHFFKEIK